MKSLNRLIYILFLCFIFFLPYVKIGAAVGRRFYSIPDFFLSLTFALICVKIALDKFKVRLGRPFRAFMAVQLVFIFLLSLSGFKILGLAQYLNAFLPHIYALILTFSFAYVFYNSGEKFLDDVKITVLLTFLISMVPAALSVFYKLGNIFYRRGSGVHYSFLCVNSSQYAIFLGIALSIYLTIDICRRPEKRYSLLFLIFSALALITVLFTGSKTGVIYIFMLASLYLVYYLVCALRMERFSLKELVNKSVYIVLISAVIITGSLSVSALFKKMASEFNPAARAAQAINYIKEQRLDEARTGRLKKGLQVFRDNFVLGVGFGNYYGFYYDFEIHNTYVSLLAETGIAGFTGFIILIGFLFKKLASIKISIPRKFVLIGVFCAYLLANIPHYMLRERWIWTYFQVILALYVINRETARRKNSAAPQAQEK